MRSPHEALHELRAMAADGRLDEFCERHGIDLLVVFGSAVDPGGPATEPRDLDLAVLAAPPPGPWGWTELASAVIALLHCDAVDVMDLSRAGVLARAGALGDGEPLYERSPGLFAREQMRAVGLRMELGWLERLRLDLLASS